MSKRSAFIEINTKKSKPNEDDIILKPKPISSIPTIQSSFPLHTVSSFTQFKKPDPPIISTDVISTLQKQISDQALTIEVLSTQINSIISILNYQMEMNVKHENDNLLHKNYMINKYNELIKQVNGITYNIFKNIDTTIEKEKEIEK